MKYSIRERPENYIGVWFVHHLQLYVASKNRDRLIEFLINQVGEKEKAWELNQNQDTFKHLYLFGTPRETIMFANKNDLIMFKLTWDEDEFVNTFKELTKPFLHQYQHQIVKQLLRDQMITSQSSSSNTNSWYEEKKFENLCDEVSTLNKIGPFQNGL